jgi:hypothetical protein
MPHQRTIPFLRLTTSARFIAALSVALTLAIGGPARGVYSAKDFEHCRRDGGRLLRVAGPQVGILIKTRQNAWLHISSGDPHKATAAKRSPVSRPRLPRKPILIDGLNSIGLRR